MQQRRHEKCCCIEIYNRSRETKSTRVKRNFWDHRVRTHNSRITFTITIDAYCYDCHTRHRENVASTLIQRNFPAATCLET